MLEYMILSILHIIKADFFYIYHIFKVALPFQIN